LSKRLHNHRAHYKQFKVGKFDYITSYEILKYDDHYIELIEDYSCKTKAQLERREGQLIRECKTAVNKYIAGRTQLEYNYDNKEKLCIIKKEYYDANKESLCINKRQYYQENKDKILENCKEYREANKEVIAVAQKQYREANKEQLSINKRQYYEENKEQLLKNMLKKYNCECGGKSTHCHKSKHLRTKKHIAYMATQIPQDSAPLTADGLGSHIPTVVINIDA
jgi:hypothetical protein